MTENHTKDPFWDDRAQSLVTTLLLHVASARPPVLRNLPELHHLLNQSNDDIGFTVPRQHLWHRFEVVI